MSLNPYIRRQANIASGGTYWALSGGAMPLPMRPTPQDVQFGVITERLNEDFAELYRRTSSVEESFAGIEKELLGELKSDTLRKMDAERYKHEDIKKVELKTSAFEYTNVEIQTHFDNVSSNLSYVIDLLERIHSTIKDAKLPLGNVTVPHFTGPMEGSIEVGQKQPWKDKLLTFFHGFDSSQDKEHVESFEIFSAMIKHAHDCLERWDTFVLQHREHQYICSRWGPSVMTGYLRTELRNLSKVKNTIKPIMDAGIRHNIREMQRIYTGMASDINKAVGQQAQDQSMFQNIGKGIADNWRTGSVRSGGAGQALPSNP